LVVFGCCVSMGYCAVLPMEFDDADQLAHRLPSAIIIGVKKSGTRALLEFLRLNPAVKAPGPEVHFFDRHFDRGFDWYRRQMPLTTVDQLTIEKSPSYFVTKTAPERVHQLDPAIKLIVVVRNPITRAISDYTQTASKRPGMPSFEHMAFTNSSGSPKMGHANAGVNTSWGAIRIGIYHRFVSRWLKFFPLQQIHFVNGERLITDPAEEIAAVEEFIGLRPTVKAEDFVLNTEKGFPCIKRTDGTTHCLGKTKGRAHPKVSPDAITRLRTFYAPENERFYDLIGRDFGW